jgi:hypothetical protein
MGSFTYPVYISMEGLKMNKYAQSAVEAARLCSQNTELPPRMALNSRSTKGHNLV